MEATNRQEDNNHQIIREAIRKLALGRGLDRINMAPVGNSGIGSARMIHGYVSKVHVDPSDQEFEEYYGTIDVREFPCETSSSEPITYKGVSLSGIQDNKEGILIIPTLFSDVTIITDAGTNSAYILNFSHADAIRLQAHNIITIGVHETEPLDTNDSNSPDYNELESTGNESTTKFSPEEIVSTVKTKDKSSSIIIRPDNISQKIDKVEYKQTTDKIQEIVGKTSITLVDNKISLGEENAEEPLVLGKQLAQLMLDFLIECSKITTPTLMGTMPALNVPNFSGLTSKIQNFLSKTSFTK